MKYFLLAICCLFFFNESYAQKRKSKASKYLTIQSGVFFDGVDKDLDEFYDPYNIGPSNYFGFGLLNVKLQRLKDNKLTGIGLKSTYSKKKAKVVARDSFGDNIWYFPHYDRKKLMFELSINQVYPLFGNMEKGLYAGPLISLAATSDTYYSFTARSFPISRRYIALQGGFQIDYFLKVSKKTLLTIGTQANLLAFRMGMERLQNPILPRRLQRTGITKAQVLIPHFPLLLGFTFSL